MTESMRPLRILAAGTREQGAGMELLRKFPDQALTLADAVGPHVMQRRQIKRCWSTDFHLGLTGVPLVIHER